VFPVRYELNLYINLLRNSVFKGLKLTNVFRRIWQSLGGKILVILIRYLCFLLLSHGNMGPVQNYWIFGLVENTTFRKLVMFPSSGD
jgi:hypothetical protein